VTASLSSGLKLLALDAKATKRPSAEIDGLNELSSVPTGSGGPVGRLTNVTVPSCVSRTKRLVTALLSSVLRLSASDWKAT